MTENQQHQVFEQKGPFSPLQTGCAFVMLTNMLIYLGVVAFVFNLLDPSKIDANYLAKRGFTARPEPEADEDRAFRQVAEQKREEQQSIQAEIVDASKLGPKEQVSPAVKLSDIGARPLASGRPEQPELPKAALTQSATHGGTGVRSAQSRLYSLSVFPQASLWQTYSPYRLPTARTITPEKYEPVPMEIALGIDFPTFTLPVAETPGAYLYTPPSPVPQPAHGGPRLNTPAVGAQNLYTNRLEQTNSPAAKDAP